MSDHFVEKCSCGVVLNTCRCMSKDKKVIIKENGCDDCQEKAKQSNIQVVKS